jgi:hypothetical protein
MLARIGVVAVLCALLACGAGSWALVQPGSSPFVAPGALAVQVEELGVGTRRISYTMANPDDGWQTRVALRLRHDGWDLEDTRYVWGDTERYRPAYTRTLRVWLLRISERAELLGDRAVASIVVRRSIRLER